MKREFPLQVRYLLALLLLAAGISVKAEERPGPGVFLPTQKDLQILWQRLEEARGGGKWDAVVEGLSRYAELVKRPEVNSVVSSGGGLALGIRSAFSRLINQLPPEALERYKARLDSLLKEEWEASVQRQSREIHGEFRHRVLRDYKNSELYPLALKEELDEAFEAGNWRRAKIAGEEFLALSQRVEAQKGAPQAAGHAANGSSTVEDSLRVHVLLARICEIQGDVDGEKAHVRFLRMFFDSGKADSLGGDLKSQAERLLALMEKKDVSAPRVKTADARQQLSALEPLVLPLSYSPAAAESHSALGSGRYRLGNVIWERRTSSTKVRPFIGERSRTAPGGDVPLPYYAVSRDGLIAFQHADRVTAYDTAKSKEIWSVSLDPDSEDFGAMRVPLVGRNECYFVVGRTLYAVRKEDGASLWQKSFFYDRGVKALRQTDLPMAGQDSFSEPARPAASKASEEKPAAREGNDAEDKEEREGDLEREPKRDPDGEDNSEKEGERSQEKKEKKRSADSAKERNLSVISYTVSPPVLFRDRVLAAVTVLMDQESLLYLTCLDSMGEGVWTSFLGSFQGGNYLGLAGTSSIPLVSGETIYDLSNMGFVCAIDAEDGTILWVSEYPRLSPRGKRSAIRDERRWHPNPILPVGQNIIVAPQDSSFLFALSKKTGGLAWRTWRESGATLAGADGRACFVVGKEVVAIGYFGADEGREVWRFGLEKQDSEKAPSTPQTDPTAPGPPGASQNGLRLSGRALLTEDALLVPCRDSLLAISYTDGKLLSRTLWDFAGTGGNILLTKNLLAVTNAEGLLVYNHFDEERARVESLPPEPMETLLQRARFHLKNGQMEAGLKDLRSWAESAPPAPSPNSVLDHLQLDDAEMVYQLSRTKEGAPFRRELLSFRVRLERTPARKVEAAIDLAAQLQKDGDATAAMATLHEALVYDNPSTEYYVEGLLRVQSAAYIRDRIAAIRKAAPHPETAFRDIDAAARKALLGARNKGTPLSCMEVVRLYPYTPAAAEAYLDLFTGYRDRQSYDQAIKALEGYLKDYPEGSDVLRVKLLIANLLYQTGQRQEAKERYLALLKENGTGTVQGVDGMGSKESVGQYVEPILKDPGLSGVTTDETPKLKFPIRMSWRSPADLHAVNRTFLQPEGKPPEALKKCFFTQSTEVIECRKIEDGLPLWRVYLEMIPGFEFDDTPFGFRFPRTGKRMISGQYAGSVLILYDDRNLFAIDPVKSTVRWHVPAGSEKTAKASSEALRQLRERFRGVIVTGKGIFASSSLAMLRHWSLTGELEWEKKVTYEPGPYPPTLLNDNLFVHSIKGLFVHDARTGEVLSELGAGDGLGGSLARPPVELPGGRLLLPYADALKLFDLEERKVTWTYRRPRSTIEEVAYFPEFPGECVIFINRPSNNWPAMVNLSLHDGSELWRYEKFPAKSNSFSVFREENRFYVIHGVDRWQLLALEARRGADDLRPLVEAAWPNEIPLGTFYSGPSQRKLHIGGDAVFFPDPNNLGTPVSVFEKAQGSSKSASASAIGKFLAEKGSFSSSIVDGKLVLLTDGGDCAFETALPQMTSAEKSTNMDLVWKYLSTGGLDSTSKLALHYFREGDRESALNLLNRSLLSEGLLLENGAEKRYLLSYMMDGIKEEYMKESVPRITSHRFLKPPSIDGELNDPWDLSTRIHLNTPRNIGTIPGPGQLRDWEGEEDLSAVLYTGWDDQYFYFALDVEDDALYPYDKDAENWRGDCLLIGLDPTGDGGFHQHGNDQLMTLALTVPKRKLDKSKKERGKKDGKDEEDEEDDQKPEGLFSVKKKDDDSGAIYEVGLPWSKFSSAFQNNVPPAPGYFFGLSLLLTDDDTGQGATKTLSLNPCHLLPRSQKNSSVWRFIIPSFFPRVTLE